MAHLAHSSQSVRNRRFIPSVYIKTMLSFVLALRKKKETAKTVKTAMSFFYSAISRQNLAMSNQQWAINIRPFVLSPLTMGSHYPHGSLGVEPLDFERCVRKINVSCSL